MITIETKKAIFEEYKDHNNKVDDIAKRHRIGRQQVARIAVEMGAEPRNKKFGRTLKKQGATARTCPKCRKTIDVKGAQFCCFCGADIRTNKELLIERINNAMRTIRFLPDSERDAMQQLMLDIKSELSK